MSKRRPFDVVTFDCYGTLIDWEAGIGAAFLRAAEAAGVRLDHASVLAAYSEIEPEVEGEGREFRSYRDVLVETSRRVASRVGWDLSPERATFLPESLPAWTPFPDTNPALERLAHAGYALGILSNVDDDLLTKTRQHFSVPFPLLVTAQQVRSYKPSRAHFVEARRRIGDANRWLHAAQSFFHDVRPAMDLGVPVAWINRRRQDLPSGCAAPPHELENLTELADWLVP